MKLRVAKKIDGMEDLPRYFRKYKGSTRSQAAARMRKWWYRDPVYRKYCDELPVDENVVEELREEVLSQFSSDGFVTDVVAESRL